MSDIQVIIKKSEYDELITIKGALEKVENKETVVIHDSFFAHSGYPFHSFRAINPDELTTGLIHALKKKDEYIAELRKENSSLEQKLNNKSKSWFS